LAVDRQRVDRNGLDGNPKLTGNLLPQTRGLQGVREHQRSGAAVRTSESPRGTDSRGPTDFGLWNQPPASVALAPNSSSCTPLAKPTDGLPSPLRGLLDSQHGLRDQPIASSIQARLIVHVRGRAVVGTSPSERDNGVA
jgi:hypothetical protein